MTKTLVILVDALWPGFIGPRPTPFLTTMRNRGHSSGLQPVLGYSAAIRATAFTGVTPDIHGVWSKFAYNPEASPFQNLTRLEILDHLPTSPIRRASRFVVSKYLSHISSGASQGNRLSIENVPIALLPQFLYRDDNAMLVGGPPVESVFARLDAEQVAWRYFNVPFFPTHSHFKRLRNQARQLEVLFVYLGGLDAEAHRRGRNEASLCGSLLQIDRAIERIFSIVGEAWGRDFHWIIFSDHGIETVRHYVDPASVLNTLCRDRRVHIAFFDSTMARIWMKDVHDQLDPSLLSGLQGRLVSSADAVRWGVNFHTREYFDWLFLLDPGTVFHPAYVSWLKPRGMHGYAPDQSSQSAVLLSSLECGRSTEHSHLMTEVRGFVQRSIGLEG